MRPRAAEIARAWLPRALILALSVVMLALGPKLLHAPVPQGAIELDTAELHLSDGTSATVQLPHRWPKEFDGEPAEARYLFAVPPAEGEGPRVVLIPTARLQMTARLDGYLLHRNTPRPSGESAGFSVMMRLPGDAGGQLEITLTRDAGIVSGYLSPVYLAPERSLGAGRWLWVMGDGVARTVALAVHLLMVFAITLVWLARRTDPIFGWLFLLGAGSLFNVITSSALMPQALQTLQPYVILLTSAMGFGMVGFALAIIEAPRPRWLRLAVIGAPLVLCLLAAAGAPLELLVAVSVVTMAAGALAGGLLLLGGGSRPTEWDRMILAVPFLLTSFFSIRDMGVVIGVFDGAFLLASYMRTLTLVAVLALLMRRLVRTLNALDRANEVQRRKLIRQEEELSQLHQREQARMVQQTRDEERQRLMRDLHDGLSGHLVSIIALSEQGKDADPAIERTAREALEDLRLVINSLDVEDGDLRLALAGFRERLGPRLRRMGVNLEWSMEDLPDVVGVTPANALSVLRILQEAVTNALKHGSARRIGVRGAPGADDRAVLTITNDLNGPAAHGHGAGRGLENMYRRARDLGGFIHFEKGEDAAVLTVNLPVVLTET